MNKRGEDVGKTCTALRFLLLCGILPIPPTSGSGGNDRFESFLRLSPAFSQNNVLGTAHSSAGFGHLAFTSLDGPLFAYHKTGVLRLWESQPNDMELQVRTLQPGGISCEATLIGMVRATALSRLLCFSVMQCQT